PWSVACANSSERVERPANASNDPESPLARDVDAQDLGIPPPAELFRDRRKAGLLRQEGRPFAAPLTPTSDERAERSATGRSRACGLRRAMKAGFPDPSAVVHVAQILRAFTRLLRWWAYRAAGEQRRLGVARPDRGKEASVTLNSPCVSQLLVGATSFLT